MTNSINGMIFDDYNQDGVQDSREPGLGGVVITAYDATGTVLDSTSSQFGATLGLYTLSIPGAAGPVRLQFGNFGSTSTLPNLIGYQPSEHARSAGLVQGGTMVAFVDGNQEINTVNLGITRPSSFCQANPIVATNCYVRGDQTNAANDVLVKYPYNATGTTPAPAKVADATQVGSTWGLAYRRSTDSLFAASYTKLLAGYKPGGNPGAIYLISGADSASPTVSSSPFVSLNAGENPHNSTNNYIPDTSAYDAVGKTGIGGLALSEDESTLYAVNLFDRSLYSIPLGVPPAVLAAGTPTSIAIPAPENCINSTVNFRPFAVTAYNGNIYVGAVCSAESTQSILDLRAYVLEYNPVTAAFLPSPVFETPLNYQRHCADKSVTNPVTCLTTGYAAAWQAWQPVSTLAYAALGNGGTIYPQPELSSLAFDNGDLILGLRDRYGDQTGHNVSGVPEARGAGDTLRACLNTSGDFSSAWTLEANGTCGANTTSGAGNGKGPGGGEYYYTQNASPYHDYVSVGGLLQLPGFAGVMAAVYDPGTTLFTGGSRTYDNVTGSTSNNYQVYNTNTFPTTYGKANGLGSLVAFCQSAPIEIGNRIWFDTNGNGIQDAGEPDVVGATVHLYAADGTTLVGTTTTDAQGNYFFNTSNVTNADSTLGLKPHIAYVIKLDEPADYAVGGPLAGYQLTVDHKDVNAQIDSKATLPQTGLPLGTDNYPQIAVDPHLPGQNDHTFDVGFTANPDLQIIQTSSAGSYQVGDTASYTLQVTNVSATGSVVLPHPVTVTYTVPAGLTGVTASAPSGWTFSPGDPVNSPTTITATYTGPYPVTSGGSLPLITITGTVNVSADAALTTTATVNTYGDTNTANNSSIVTVTISTPTPTPSPTATATPSPTPTPSPTATPTPTSSPTPTPLPGPDLGIAQINSAGSGVQVGQNVIYTLTVANAATAGPAVGPITVTLIVPLGLNNVFVSEAGWSFTNSSSTSPGIIVATYNGPFPVGSDVGLPPITVTGTTTSDAVPDLVTNATVSTPGDTNSTNNFSQNTVIVSPVPTPIPTATPTPTPMPTPTATPAPPLDLSIAYSHLGTGIFQVGQAVTYNATVSTVSGTVILPDSISVSVVIPVGLTGVVVSGTSWTFAPSNATSPSLITGTYTGLYPVTTATVIPPIMITGTLTGDAVPNLITSAMVNTSGDSNEANNLAVDTLPVIAPPTPTPIPTATAIPLPSIDLAIVLTHQGGDNFQVNQPVNYNLVVSDVNGSVSKADGIRVTALLPVGLTGVTASGTNWTITLSSTTSPGTLTAIYNGEYPVTPDTILSPITLSGTLTDAAFPAFTAYAAVASISDNNLANNSSVNTIFVSPLPPSPTIQLPVTPVPTLVPDVSVTLNTPTGNNYQVGQSPTYILSVVNASGAGPVIQPHGIVVNSVLPVGLTNVTASGSNWLITLTSATSPGELTATYIGAYPVAPGIVLPPIVLTGTLTSVAQPTLTLSATVTTSTGSASTQSSSTGTVFVVPTPPQPALPDVAMALNSLQGNTFHVGDQVAYILGASVVTGPIVSPNSIQVAYVIPLGLSNVQVYGHNWSIVLSATNGPLLLTADYVGGYPVATGALPLIIVTGKLTQDAVGSLTTTAEASTAGDSNPANNTAVDTLFIQQEPEQCHKNDQGKNQNSIKQGCQRQQPLASGIQ